MVATGFAPRIELAMEAGVATKRGIVVNEYVRTEDPSVYAVGDAAEINGRSIRSSRQSATRPLATA